MMAYIYLNLTDRWGMVPYSEALKGSENVKPAHDSVESIYTSLFNNLDAAVNMMDNGGLNGDILFGGDMNQWVNMAAFIKMRMAMRISDVDSSTAQSKFLEAHSVLKNLNSSWNLHYPYLTSDSFDNPWQDRYESRYDFVVSEKLIDHLKATSDPRLPYMADGTVLSAGLEYVGLEYGLENPSTIETALSGIDSRIIYDGTSQGGWIFTYSEFAFMMADAYLKGWHNVGDAPTWTKIGIESSCVRWGVSAAAAASFAAAATVSGVNDIAEAVWTDMFLQGYEAWVQWRRYDYPVLLPPSAALTGTGVPVRNGYGTSMKVNNEASYKAAVAAQGPDTQDTKIWWDTK